MFFGACAVLFPAFFGAALGGGGDGRKVGVCSEEGSLGATALRRHKPCGRDSGSGIGGGGDGRRRGILCSAPCCNRCGNRAWVSCSGFRAGPQALLAIFPRFDAYVDGGERAACETGTTCEQYGRCETGSGTACERYGHCDTGTASERYGHCDTGTASERYGQFNLKADVRQRHTSNRLRFSGDSRYQGSSEYFETVACPDVSRSAFGINQGFLDRMDAVKNALKITEAVGMEPHSAMYEYHNRANIRHIETQGGWQNNLPWQGFNGWVKVNGGFIDLAFDCYGRGKMKCSRVYKRSENVWECFDYKGRLVTIEKIMEMEYCADC